MKLPEGDKAQISESKITGYLLSFVHEDGRSKAAFFRSFGFSLSEWNTLADALKDHAVQCEVVGIEDSPFGKRYVVEGEIDTPDGRAPLIRTVWFIETGEEIPRLVTAYPLRRKP